MNILNLIYRIKAYLKFLIKSKSKKGYGIHSPLVFNFTTEILCKKIKTDENLRNIFNLRRELLKNRQVISVVDYGMRKWEKPYQISQIVKKAVSSTKKCELLYNIALHYQPAYIIELGTSVGISIAALASGCHSAKVYSVEGSEALASIAKQNLNALGLIHVEIVIGHFDHVLPELLKQIQVPFIAFIDGNHSEGATIEYFNMLAEKLDENSVIIIDDIYWSKGMERAWKQICKHERSTICVDLFNAGIVFYKEKTAHCYYAIRY